MTEGQKVIVTQVTITNGFRYTGKKWKRLAGGYATNEAMATNAEHLHSTAIKSAAKSPLSHHLILNYPPEKRELDWTIKSNDQGSRELLSYFKSIVFSIRVVQSENIIWS